MVTRVLTLLSEKSLMGGYPLQWIFYEIIRRKLSVVDILRISLTTVVNGSRAIQQSSIHGQP